MSDAMFYAIIGGACAQIAMLAAFYYAVFRQLFRPPDRTNFLPTLLFLMFFQIGFPIMFVVGWFKCRTHGLVRVMGFWSLALLVTVICFVTMSWLDGNQSEWKQAVVSVCATLMTAFLGAFGLIPHFRLDDRLRSLVRNPNDTNIERVVALGPVALPHLNRLLGSEYAPVREAIVICLGHMGTNAIPMLQAALADEDANVSAAAASAIKRIES